MERLIEIPVIVKYDIGEIYSHYGISEYKTGDIYLFDPNHSMDVELDDSGFFEQIDNSKCDFICNEAMELGGIQYEQDEMVKDLTQVSDEALNCLVLIGRIKKILQGQKPVKEVVQSKPKTKPKYSDIAKALNLSFAELKKRAKEIDIEIKKASDKLSKKKMTEIIGTLSK